MRRCSKTGLLMSNGWYFENTLQYASSEKIALEFCNALGYNTLQEAYDEGVCYYTEWEEGDVEYDED